jgi:hypothetical protein
LPNDDFHYVSDFPLPTTTLTDPPNPVPTTTTDTNLHHSPIHDTSTPADTIEPDLPHDQPIVPLRQSTRLKSQPAYLLDYVCNPSMHSVKSSSSGILYPISQFHSCANLSASHSKFALSVAHDVEPVNYHQAST